MSFSSEESDFANFASLESWFQRIAALNLKLLFWNSLSDDNKPDGHSFSHVQESSLSQERCCHILWKIDFALRAAKIRYRIYCLTPRDKSLTHAKYFPVFKIFLFSTYFEAGFEIFLFTVLGLTHIIIRWIVINNVFRFSFYL